MIYKKLVPFPTVTSIYTYFNAAATSIQLIAILCLYPCFYPIFDGVKIFTYLFILSSLLMVFVYLIQSLASCCCESNKSLLNIFISFVSFVSSVLLLVGGIIYSPLIGHQEVRQAIFIIGELGFLSTELIKLNKFYSQLNGKIFFNSGNSELDMCILASLSWLSQLMGTLFFVYNTYYQKLMIIGIFFYGVSSMLWAIKTWILTSKVIRKEDNLDITQSQMKHMSLPHNAPQ